MSQHRKLSVEHLELRSLMTANLATANLATLVAANLPASYSVTGAGNNLANPTWGSAGADLLRSIVPANYGNGISTPNGQDLPSARDISNIVGSQSGDVLDTTNLSAFTYAWGQFIDHDLDLTPDGGTSDPITVPTGDPTFDPNSTGTQTLPFTRSITDPTTGTSTSNPLNQPTVVTSFLDGSMIYGSDPTRAAALRTFQGGQLKTSAGDLPPLNTAGLPNDNEGLAANSSLFLAGDVRANENIELTSLQTLFVREHNYWAAKISAANPSLTDEQIYQGARSIVIAEIQSITYNQFLPALLGTNAITPYKGYNPSVNPGITPEFSEAAYRFGHSQLDDDVQFMTNSGGQFSFTYTMPDGTQSAVNTSADVSSGDIGMPLVDAFFAPYVLQQSGVEDSILKYLASDTAQAIDTKMVDSVRNVLFGAPGSGAGGQDLFALDIQRGRDVGLPTYNEARVAYGLPAVTSFSQITKDPAMQAELKSVYGNVNNVELFVGGLAETHAAGSSMGATFQAIIANQFERIRDGDRLWYQNTFHGAALAAIQNTTLADIIRRDTSVTNLQSNVFLFQSSISGTAFTDTNGNGQLDRLDRVLAGQKVQLLDAATGDVVATTTTSLLGTYSFKVTEAGQYVVQIAGSGASSQASVTSKTVTVSSGNQFLRVVLAVPPSHNSGHPTSPGNGGSNGDPGNWDKVMTQWQTMLTSIIDKVHAMQSST